MNVIFPLVLPTQTVTLATSPHIGFRVMISLFVLVMLLYYPAVKFQKLLRENYIGEAFWVELEKNIKNKYQESLNKENDLKLDL